MKITYDTVLAADKSCMIQILYSRLVDDLGHPQKVDYEFVEFVMW